MLATDGTWREVEDTGGGWRAMIAPAFATSLVLALAVAVFLLARRSSGALDTPLAPIPLVATAFALVAWANAIRLCLRDRRAAWLAAAVLVLVAIACSFPGERTIDWLVWLSAFAAFGLCPATRNSPARGSVAAEEQVLQQLTRSLAADGTESIHGTLFAEFAPGERTAILHVAFCPPFERLPTVDAEAEDGDVKIAQVLHQGARLEARIPHASSTLRRVTVEFLATDRPPPASAGP